MLNLRSLACVGLFHTRAARRLQIGPSLDLTQTRVSQRYHWKDTTLSIKIEPSGGGRNLKLPRWLIYITQTRIGRIRGEERGAEIEERRRLGGPVVAFAQTETQPGFIATSAANAGVAGGKFDEGRDTVV